MTDKVNPEKEQLIECDLKQIHSKYHEGTHIKNRWCDNPRPVEASAPAERRQGHKALRVKGRKLESFGPHPPAPPTSSDIEEAVRVVSGKLENFTGLLHEGWARVIVEELVRLGWRKVKS